MPTYLEGVAVQFYRGIGPETQYIAPFSEMNFFVGPNNAGKSIVLNLIKDRLPFVVSAQRKAFDAISVEAYRGAETGSFMSAVGISKQLYIQQALRSFKDVNHTVDAIIRSTVEEIANKLQLSGNIWLLENDNKVTYLEKPSVQDAISWFADDNWRIIWHYLTGQTGGGLKAHWIPDTLAAMASLQRPQFQETLRIDAKRVLGPKSEKFDDLSGKGVIDRLAELQNPDHADYDAKRRQFEEINAFVQTVTGKTDAYLDVPSERTYLQVHMDNKVLPLSSLGTGIHEVILIAAFCTIHKKKIMCIEEPEIHLHPVLQRKLIRYLQEKTENQYFIATHSAAFIDTPGASVFRVHNDGVQTYVTPAITKGVQRQICDDLGYRASDILQANAVIWVEGPSDRIYIRHWLNAVNPDLIEGVHYTIMFYGGGLIKHLSADDDAAADFIRLRDLNRHIAVVIDSDKDGPSARLKPAAQRIKDEMTSDDSVVWITKGREIENYVDPVVLHEALASIHTKVYGGMRDIGPHDHAFYFSRKGPKAKDGPIYKDGDKVGAAERVCQQDANLDVLDLREKVTTLAGMIAKANGL